MQSLGEQLRRARQEKNLTLEEVNNRTKIQLRYLEALEKGDPTPFAGEVYFKGALRNYAQVVGLDPEKILAQFYQLKQKPPIELPPPPEQKEPAREIKKDRETEQTRPASTFSRNRLAFNWWVILLVLAIVVAGIWISVYKSRNPSKPPVLPGEFTPPQKEQPAEEPTGPPAVTPEEPSLQVIIDSHQSTVAETAYMVSGAEKLEISLNFTGNCWINLFSDGHELYQQTYRSGQEISAEGNQKIWVRLGNPLAVKLTINGENIKELQEQVTAHNYLFNLQP